ncbi:MAG TPA: DUF1501 domain-containing protein [Planctomycetota bacterium]
MTKQGSDKAHSSGLSRRTLLSSSASLTAASLLSGQASASPSRRGSARPVLVHIFLRGAMDGLTMVPPHGDDQLYARRPNLGIPPPGQTNGAVDLDGFFGLAPAAAPLLTPYSNGHLAVVNACGSDDATRSHFEAFVRMESGDSSLPTGVITTGWLARYLTATAASATGSLRAIASGSLLPFVLRGASNALPIPSFGNFVFPGRVTTATQREAVVLSTYARRAPPVGQAALDTIAAFGLGGIDFENYVPENGAQYPDTGLGLRMRNTAALIKGDIGLEAITIDIEGWDLHASQGPLVGPMARLMADLTGALEAFYLDLLGHLDDYLLVCVSEFGRKAAENGSAGTDHGHGNAMFVLGGGVNGGQVISDWPGLRPIDLDQGDLAITIDYRDILAEILLERFGFTDLATVFPAHTFVPRGVTT